MDIYTIFFVFASFGAILGSFANMLIYRLPRGMELVRQRSHCPECGYVLRVAQLVPLLSYLWQKWRCVACHKPIARRYFVTELVLALLCGGIGASYGLTVQAALLCLLALLLVVLVVVDLEHMIIPDELQIALALLGLGYGLLLEKPAMEMVAGAAAGAAFAYSLRQGMWWWKRREALGWGDVKFFAVAGIYLSPMLVGPFCFVAGVAGILTAKLKGKNHAGEFPFGPALAISLFVCVLAPGVMQGAFQQVIDFLVEFNDVTADK